MLELSFIRNNSDEIKNTLKKRLQNDKLEILNSLLKEDKKWRENRQKADKLRHKRNVLTEQINRLVNKKQNAATQISEAKKLAQQIKNAEETEKKTIKKIKPHLLNLPNILHKSVPTGKSEKDNVQLKKWGEPVKKNKISHHGEFAEKNKWANFKTASKISGAGFYFLSKELALMEHALIRLALDHLISKNFSLVNPPLMMRKNFYEGIVDLEAFENVMYKIEGSDLFLIPTSEHPLAAMHFNEIINSKELPLKYAGFSPCFRKEIGKHSIDERGLFRVHQFYKIEQFVFCLPQDSWKMHEQLLQNTEELIKKLKIPYRVMNLCSADVGNVASKTFDVEAWSPRENKYIEIASVSNCTDYQANALKIRYRKGKEKEILHTLNATAIPTSRTLRLIIENFQTDNQTIRVPKALQEHMNGLKEIPLKKK